MVIWKSHAHRALRPSWFDAEQLTNRAYRRQEKDTDGLSVACSHEYAKTGPNSGNGVAAVETGFIIELGLRVLFTPDDAHGVIDGLPPHNALDDEYNRALELADRLVDASVVTIDPWRRKST